MKGHLELTSIGFGRCHETDEAGWKLVGLRTSVDVGRFGLVQFEEEPKCGIGWVVISDQTNS